MVFLLQAPDELPIPTVVSWTAGQGSLELCYGGGRKLDSAASLDTVHFIVQPQARGKYTLYLGIQFCEVPGFLCTGQEMLGSV